MKTAEEWVSGLHAYGEEYQPEDWIEMQAKKLVEVIQAIQADAREDMLEDLETLRHTLKIKL